MRQREGVLDMLRHMYVQGTYHTRKLPESGKSQGWTCGDPYCRIPQRGYGIC